MEAIIEPQRVESSPSPPFLASLRKWLRCLRDRALCRITRERPSCSQLASTGKFSMIIVGLRYSSTKEPVQLASQPSVNLPFRQVSKDANRWTSGAPVRFGRTSFQPRRSPMERTFPACAPTVKPGREKRKRKNNDKMTMCDQRERLPSLGFGTQFKRNVHPPTPPRCET